MQQDPNEIGSQWSVCQRSIDGNIVVRLSTPLLDGRRLRNLRRKGPLVKLLSTLPW
jgi:hypothetical protein